MVQSSALAVARLCLSHSAHTRSADAVARVIDRYLTPPIDGQRERHSESSDVREGQRSVGTRSGGLVPRLVSHLTGPDTATDTPARSCVAHAHAMDCTPRRPWAALAARGSALSSPKQSENARRGSDQRISKHLPPRFFRVSAWHAIGSHPIQISSFTHAPPLSTVHSHRARVQSSREGLRRSPMQSAP